MPRRDSSSPRGQLCVSDRFYSDPAISGLSLTAIGVWSRAGSWSAHHGTNGRIPMAVLREWEDLQSTIEDACRELTLAEVWQCADDTHDYYFMARRDLWSIEVDA